MQNQVLITDMFKTQNKIKNEQAIQEPTHKPVQASYQQKVANKQQKIKTKTVNQIINIDSQMEGQHQNKHALTSADLFVNELTKKCSMFFNWISQTNSIQLAEQLWKNDKMIVASGLYPELNNQEIQKLIERDWKYMSEKNRQMIYESYNHEPNQYELQRQIEEESKNSIFKVNYQTQ